MDFFTRLVKITSNKILVKAATTPRTVESFKMDYYPVFSSLCSARNRCRPSSRPRYRVVFGKDAQDLEQKLNDPRITPAGYAITNLTFNSARAEYLVILPANTAV
ncbi:MAG TPA: hypothetical protein VFK06_03035 [Candidatus Angelobacter sp.]|nr:hypothetical protein [Candidatus Angelobacter sp.]